MKLYNLTLMIHELYFGIIYGEGSCFDVETDQ